METRKSKARGRYDSKYIIHEGRGFVYFVMQKVACSSIKTALLPFFDVNPKRFEAERADGTRVVLVHKIFDRSPYQVDKETLLRGLDGDYRGHFKFAFVRNPWDRLVSCYSQKIASGPHIPERKRANLNPPGEEDRFHPDMTFAEFVEAVHATPDEEANIHFRSQYVTVCGPEGRILADFVGRFENLREDFRVVAGKIGAPGLELPHRLKSPSRQDRHYTEFYDERLKKLVRERYQGDVDVFGYSY